jgi:hypothetical protein
MATLTEQKSQSWVKNKAKKTKEKSAVLVQRRLSNIRQKELFCLMEG